MRGHGAEQPVATVEADRQMNVRRPRSAARNPVARRGTAPATHRRFRPRRRAMFLAVRPLLATPEAASARGHSSNRSAMARNDPGAMTTYPSTQKYNVASSRIAGSCKKQLIACDLSPNAIVKTRNGTPSAPASAHATPDAVIARSINDQRDRPGRPLHSRGNTAQALRDPRRLILAKNPNLPGHFLRAKVFWSFFSKKDCLPALCLIFTSSPATAPTACHLSPAPAAARFFCPRRAHHSDASGYRPARPRSAAALRR